MARSEFVLVSDGSRRLTGFAVWVIAFFTLAFLRFESPVIIGSGD